MLFGFWAVAFLGSFVAPVLLDPGGSGFSRTWSRFVPFVWLQLMASFLALLTAAVAYRRWSDLSRGAATLGLLPLVLALLMIGTWAFLAYLAG